MWVNYVIQKSKFWKIYKYKGAIIVSWTHIASYSVTIQCNVLLNATFGLRYFIPELSMWLKVENFFISHPYIM